MVQEHWGSPSRERSTQTEMQQIVDEEVRKKTAEFVDKETSLRNEIADRIRTEHALRRVEARYKSIFNAELIGIYFAQPDTRGRVTEANTTFCQLTGYNQADIQSRELCWADLISPKYRNRDETAIAEAKETGRFTPYETRLIRKDGQTMAVIIGGSLVEEADNELACFLLDITPRKQMEDLANLRAQQQTVIAELGQYALQHQNLQEVMDTTAHFVCQTLNTPYCKIFEWRPDREQLVWRSVYGFPRELIGKTVETTSDTQVEYTLQSNGPVIVENIWTEPRFKPSWIHRQFDLVSGASVLIKNNSTPFGVLETDTEQLKSFSEGDLLFLQGVSHILSLAVIRSQMTDVLQASETRFRQVVESNMIPIHFIDQYSYLTDANEAFARLLGYSLDEIRSGQISWKMITPSEFYPKDEAALKVLALGGVIKPYEKQYIRKDGSVIDILIGGAHLEGTAFPGVCFVLDITAKKASQRELELANQRKNQFLANMSHELRTPLNAVIGYSEILENGMTGPLTDKQKQYVHNVASSGKHLLAMVNDLLDIARIESGGIHVEQEPVNLTRMVRELEPCIREMADKSGINLTFDLQSDLENLKSDPIRLRQIMLNLLSNAIKFRTSPVSIC